MWPFVRAFLMNAPRSSPMISGMHEVKIAIILGL